MLYLCILVFFVFFAAVAMTIQEGLWNNAINLIATLLASMLAAAVGPAIGVFALDKFGKPPEAMWYFTFAGTWLAFVVALTVLRLMAERLSRTRMKFVPPLEFAGGLLTGLVAAVMFTSFAAFTLYVMPIRAGEWDFNQAAPWQQATMKQGSGPFFTVLRATLGEEVADEYFKQ